jgi:hypothetical protein
MNPYDFVRVDWSHPPERRAAKPHHRFDGLSGRLEGTLTALTPLFLPARRPNGLPLTDRSDATLFSQASCYRNAQNPTGYFIAGSSLKGFFRTVVETIAQGCVWFCAEQNHLPDAFNPCPYPPGVCPACRLFGLIKGPTLRLGNVGFDDAVCTHMEQHPAIYTVVLSSPKPRHTAFYLDGAHVTGRKFYFHHTHLLTTSGWLPPHAQPQQRQNQYIRPLGTGSTFTFSAVCVNVEEDDFAALLYAMTLEAGMRHKFGYAKPCGLGSVHVQCTRLTLQDPTARYRQGTGDTVYEGDALAAEVARRVAPLVARIPAVTLADLRRIWQWPPVLGVTYRYPTQTQFAAHPRDPVAATDTW